MRYQVISGDSHIDMTWMPGDLWAKNVPSKLADAAPKIVQSNEGPRWVAEGRELGVYGGLGFGFRPPQRGVSKRIDRMFEIGFYEGGPHPTTPELRLKDMQTDGVDAEVIYGITGIGTRLQNPELIRYVYNVYNDWVADFCKAHPGRWAALACIPFHDPQVAAAELRRAAGLGLKGADFAVSKAVKPLWHRDWDVLWATAAECHMPISFHPTVFPGRAPDDEQMAKEYNLQYRATVSTQFQVVPGTEYLASIIFSGACDRFPDFKFVLGESGVTWLPHVLNRMDEEYEDAYYHLNYSLKPSEFWRRQGYTTYQHERNLAQFLPLVGEDNVIWGADYPHPDGVFPDSKETIAGDLAKVSQATRRKVTCENAAKLYRFLS